MLEFDKYTHTYRWNGVKVPSVTSFIPFDASKIDPVVLENARLEGIANHAQVEEYYTSREAKTHYLEVFERFLKENESVLGKWIGSEMRLYSKSHKFSGTLDMPFENGIVDLKRTIGDLKHHALQLGAYNVLTSENKIIKKTKNLFVLEIREDGYKLQNVFNPQAESIFLGAVKAYWYQDNFKKYLEK